MTKVISPQAVLSYPHLFEPNLPPGATEPVYSCALVFEKGTDLSELKKAALAAATEKFGNKAEGLIRDGKLKMPFRNDAEDKGYPAGSIFMNVKNKSKPGIVSTYPGQDGKPTAIDSPDQVYAGCHVRASLRAYAYDVSGNKGVAFSLGNLQKLADGDRLDGRKRAEDEFEADLSAKPADLDDLI
ncbi:Protein of unknown function DUF2815 [uncultured Caudovirales phage]|uniref:DUF2815 family protein n=1 Tax=uncultured Caudovirales phage TaxID=2100421 RepID=A0A6J5KJW2_9CAUD|nr:Protein of unknown function DUF2815 [uncultured Caudovirales phage]